MKKILLSTAFLLALFVTMQSCHKEILQKEMVKDITIDTTIKSGSDYLLNLAPYGDEGYVATILDAGNNFSVSRLENETDMFTTVYHYTPAAKFSGIDYVTLSIKPNPADGQGNSKDSTIIYINLTVK